MSQRTKEVIGITFAQESIFVSSDRSSTVLYSYSTALQRSNTDLQGRLSSIRRTRQWVCVHGLPRTHAQISARFVKFLHIVPGVFVNCKVCLETCFEKQERRRQGSISEKPNSQPPSPRTSPHKRPRLTFAQCPVLSTSLFLNIFPQLLISHRAHFL